MDTRSRRVTWADAAVEHLDEAVAYLAPRSLAGAHRLLESAIAAAASLETLSERGRVVPELELATIRELLVGRYRLIYSIGADEVVVLAFLHGARDLQRLRERGSLEL